MNFFVGSDSALEEEQHNVILSGPSKPPEKTKNEKHSRNINNSAIGNSLMNLSLKKNVIATSKKDEKVEKYKNKTIDGHKPKPISKIKQLLSDRLKMYITAEENARKVGEMRRGRHLHKKIQILNALIVHHDSGNIVDPDNIPPEIKNNELNSINPQLGVTFKESAEITVISRLTDTESSSISDTDSEDSIEKILGTLRLRRDQYKISVAQNKSGGNVPRALEHLNIVKMFDLVIRHLEMGEQVDLNELPGPPDCPICHISSEEKNSRHTEVKNATEENSDTSFKETIISQSTILQALEDRLRAYEILRMNAKKEKNVGQALHIERIIKIYKDAIKLHKVGKAFPINELPSPPGFAPIANLKKPHKFPSKKNNS